MKKVFFLILLSITILTIKAQNMSQISLVDSLKSKPKVSYWNHSELWINQNSMGINIINGLSINKRNFIGIGIGSSMNGGSRMHTNYLSFGIRYQHDFMTNSRVSPFIYANTGFEYGFGPKFAFREMNLTNSIGTGVKFHTKKDISFGLAFELKNSVTLYRANVEYIGSAPMKPILKFFINFGSGNKAKKQAENLKAYY